MKKEVAIVNWKTGEETRCSLIEASRIVGISERQMHRWKIACKEGHILYKEYNYYTVFFKTKNIKQPRKGQPNYPYILTKSHI